MVSAAAGWYADPTGRFDHRYWDGSVWTVHAARRGVQSEDPLQDAAFTGPSPAGSGRADLTAPTTNAARPSRSTKVKVLWLAGVPALVVGFMIVAMLLPPPSYYGGQVVRFLLWTAASVGLIGLVAFVIVAVKTRRPGFALSRGLAWIALSVVTIVMVPGTVPIAMIAFASYVPLSFRDPFIWHRPNTKAIAKQYFEVWSWIGRRLAFHTNYGIAAPGT